MSLTATLGRDEERLTVAGREYVLTAPTLGAMIAAERELRRHALNPLRRAAECASMVPVEQAKEYWRLAFELERDWHPDLQTLMATSPVEMQLAAAALMMLHRHHRAEINTLEQASEWVARCDLEHYQAVMAALMPPSPGAVGARPLTPPTGPS